MAIEKAPLVRIEDVAEYFGVSVSTVRGWIRNNVLPADSYMKIGRTYRFKIHHIEEAFMSLDKGTAEEAEKDHAEGQIAVQLNLDFNDQGAYQ